MRATVLIVSLFVNNLSAHARPLQIGVIADINHTECQTTYPANSLTAFGQMLGNHSLDHIISTGDVVHGECTRYSGSAPYQDVVKGMWEEFDAKFYKRAQNVEGTGIILSPGNHDAPFLSSSSRETFRAENAEFVRHWQNLKPHLNVEIVNVPGAKDHYPYYWAYTYDNVLFVVLQSTRTHTLSDSAEQKRWLTALLQSPRARSTRLQIAFGHIPPYAVLDPGVGNKYREILEKEQVGAAGALTDLLLDNGVDLLVVGHSHAPYPGELKRKSDGRQMKILSMPCGHAPRKLYSKSEIAPRGYALVKVNEENEISLSVHNWADGKQIPRAYFPKSIPVKNGKATYQLTADY